MSEYQYYEFRAIDHPLTEDRKAKVSALSSRAQVTSHFASFVYHYGDFRGDPEKLMTDDFDAMLYMTNWGSRRLMFRIPCSLIDTKQGGLYCISGEMDWRKTKDEENVILDMNFHDEGQADWTEGEGWLDDLVELRKELIQGDFRVLYLAWLKVAGKALEEDIDGDTLEPPVPAGLGQLSPALKTFVRFLEIDKAMIAVAAQKSGEQQKKHLQLETWIEKLPETEQHDFLVRLSRGENNLSILLNRRLHELAAEAQPQRKAVDPERRTISALIEAAEIWRQKKKEENRRKADLARQRKLEALAGKERQVWEEIEVLIEEKKAKSYERAVELLTDLRDLAKYQGDLERFRNRLTEIERTYSNRSALLRRMRQSKLIGDTWGT
ncbi:MAG: hypothetical protein QME81_03870 [bacterium]|nr:hypothetical protein [bacterium]